MQLKVVGLMVDGVDLEGSVSLSFTEGVNLRIESPFEMTQPSGGGIKVDPEKLGAKYAPLSVLLGDVVASAQADQETGALHLVFRSGLVIHVPPDPDFEAWTAGWGDGVTAVALPGGGLATWGLQ